MEEHSSPPGAFGFSFNIGKPAFEQANLPLHIAVVGDFSGAGQRQRGPIPVPEDIAVLLNRSDVQIDIEVANHINRQPAHLSVRYAVTDMSDFTPAGIIAQVPELTAMYLFRERLALMAKGDMSAEEFVSGLDAYGHLEALMAPLRLVQQAMAESREVDQAPVVRDVTPPRDAEEDIAARILDMVDIAPSANQPSSSSRSNPRTLADQLASHIGGQRAKRVVMPEIAQALALVTDVLNKQVNAVLHHPQFQRLEAAWRGLQFLFSQSKLGPRLKVELLDVSEDSFTEAVQQDLFGPEKGAGLSLVLLNFAIKNTMMDLNQLRELGEAAEAVQVPMVFAVDTTFFGVTPGVSPHDFPYPGNLLARTEYQQWNALRAKECSRWLAATWNRFLLRLPYTPENTRGLEFSESSHGHGEHLWGSPIWLLAALIMRSFERTDWPTEISGPEFAEIAGLDLHALLTDGDDEVQFPLEQLLDAQMVEDLATAGFISLTCRANHDAAFVLHAATLRIPPRYNSEQATQSSQEMVSLPYQLMVARVAAALGEQLQAAVSATSGEKIKRLDALLRHLIADTGADAAFEIQAAADAHKDHEQVISLYLRLGRNILNGAELRLEFAI